MQVTVTGLLGTAVLQNNGGDDLTLTTDGTFPFASELEQGDAYAVSVLAQPSSPSQTCTLTNPTGTIADADVADITLTCSTRSFAVHGTVSGLEGSGLVLQNNGVDDQNIDGDGAFSFTTAVASGQPYLVTVSVEPSDPTQVCTVTHGSGTMGGADVADVTVVCDTVQHTIGGTITGLGAAPVILQNNGGDTLSRGIDGVFTFATPLDNGSNYAVTVSTQPADRVCTVSAGTGPVLDAPVTSVVVSCTAWAGAGATWVAGGHAYGRYTWAQAGTTNNGRANAEAACVASGGTLARPNSQEAWDALRANLPENSRGYWIDGHNNFTCGTATPGAPKAYQYGNMYTPAGTPLLYTGCNCNMTEQGLVAYRYEAANNAFDGCQGTGGMAAGYLGVMDEKTDYNAFTIDGFVCAK